ncbi:hypothetical protein KI387_025588, partial [Taxus chinensis]
VAGMGDVSEVDAKVELIDWAANGSAMEVITVVGIEAVCVVKVAAVLVGGGVVEVVVAEADGLTGVSTSLGR